MTTALAAYAPRPSDTAGARVAGWVGKIARAWSRERTYRRALAEMRALSTDALLDVGIYRGDLERILREHRASRAK